MRCDTIGEEVGTTGEAVETELITGETLLVADTLRTGVLDLEDFRAAINSFLKQYLKQIF